MGIIIGKNLIKSDTDFTFKSDSNTNKDGYMLLIKWDTKNIEDKIKFSIKMYFNELVEWFDLDEVINKEVIKWERILKTTGNHSIPFRLPNRANNFEIQLDFLDINSSPIVDVNQIGDLTIYAIPIMSY